MKDALLKQVLFRIIDWYRENERPLPWRETPPDPYHVWVSEIMLQQTRIEAVVPYYHRFLSRLPHIKALAQAPEELLLKLWEGLGYYSRVRNLSKAAQIVCSEYNGVMPSHPRELQKLPGIGSYTAGAIASIAFGEPAPAVDGNVLRVLSRITASEDDIALLQTRKRVEKQLQALYPSGPAAGHLTQGLMELGEVVCIPNGAPLCDRCPVADFCLAKKQGVQNRLPVKSAKKDRKIQKRTVLILEHEGRYAIGKRAAKGLLASMPEFPAVEDGESLEAFLSDNGILPLDSIPCGESVHVFTHIEWHMKGLWIQCSEKSDSFSWYTAKEIAQDIALPTAFRYFRKQIEKHT